MWPYPGRCQQDTIIIIMCRNQFTFKKSQLKEYHMNEYKTSENKQLYTQYSAVK